MRRCVRVRGSGRPTAGPRTVLRESEKRGAGGPRDSEPHLCASFGHTLLRQSISTRPTLLDI